jgi:DNA-binding transcriptional regulator YiaG
VAAHEKVMLNKMVQRIRSRTIEQIRSQTGLRQRHFDSTTGETASTRAVAAYKDRRQLEELLLTEGWDSQLRFQDMY